jgi:hypothetical protein
MEDRRERAKALIIREQDNAHRFPVLVALARVGPKGDDRVKEALVLVKTDRSLSKVKTAFYIEDLAALEVNILKLKFPLGRVRGLWYNGVR